MPARACFDSSLLAKCYLDEELSDAVRRVASSFDAIHSSALGRVELASALLRAHRERRITASQLSAIMGQWEEDEAGGAWKWIPLSEEALEMARRRMLDAPRSLPLYASDAIHLAAARLAGFDEFWSADVKQLAAARYFGLDGRRV